MRKKLIENELFIAVHILLSPYERVVYEKLTEGITERKRYGKQVGFKTLMRLLKLDAKYTKIVIDSLMEKIGSMYELKESQNHVYKYYVLCEKKNI